MPPPDGSTPGYLRICPTWCQHRNGLDLESRTPRSSPSPADPPPLDQEGPLGYRRPSTNSLDWLGRNLSLPDMPTPYSNLTPSLDLPTCSRGRRGRQTSPHGPRTS